MDKHEFGFKVYDLSNATVTEEIKPVEIDINDYTPLEQFVYNLGMLPSKPKRVANKTLSINGRVIQDKMDKYLSNPSESSSALKEILKTPRHYLLHKTTELNKKDKSHFELGTFCHSAFLEPNKFDKVTVEPKHNKATKQGILNLIQFYWTILGKPYEDISNLKQSDLIDRYTSLKKMAENKGYTFIKEDYAQIINCVKMDYHTYGDGILPKLFKNSKSEVSMYGKDFETGLKVKVRPDAIMLEENFGVNGIISIKTTSATTIESFFRDAAKYKYELSEGMYLDVATQITDRKFTATVMVMLQTVMPYGIALFYWDAEDLEVGKYKYRHALGVLDECRKNDTWRGFDCKAEVGNFGLLEMKLPNYIKLELQPQGTK